MKIREITKIFEINKVNAEPNSTNEQSSSFQSSDLDFTLLSYLSNVSSSKVLSLGWRMVEYRIHQQYFLLVIFLGMQDPKNLESRVSKKYLKRSFRLYPRIEEV